MQNNPTNTAGGNEFILSGRNQNGQVRRGLIQFDIAGSGIPTGATINSVSLTLYLKSWSGLGSSQPFGNPRTVYLHPFTSEWGDGTTVAGGGGGQGIASAANGDVSWNNRSFSTSPPTPPLLTWTTPGGDFLSTDSDSLIITNATAVGDAVNWTGSGLATDVQDWLDGAEDNYGWILLIPNDQTTPNNTLLEFYSREVADAGLRPVLTIDFTAAEAVPEPATWTFAATGLVLLGLVGARYRRRSRAGV